MGNNSYKRQCDWAIEYRVCGCGPCRGSLEIYCHFNLIGHGPFISNVDIFQGRNWGVPPKNIIFPKNISHHKKKVEYIKKMPQRRDNAGAVCHSGMGMLFLNRQFLPYRRLLHQKMGQNFASILLVPSEVVQLRRTTSGDVANFRPIRGREIISH